MIFSAHSATAQVSTVTFALATLSLSRRVRSAVFSQKGPSSRRLFIHISSPLLLLHYLSHPNHVMAASMLDKYVKRKKLDPLEVYVPAVLLTQLQIKDLEETLENEKPQYTACRSLLRSGPAASLRINIKAVAQYATDSGYSETAFNSVDKCLRALEEVDSLLLRASRNDLNASTTLSMKANISIALEALDSILNTVPPDVLDKAKAIADAYRKPAKDEPTEKLDAEMKQLESLL